MYISIRSWSANGRYLVGNLNDQIYRCRFESLNDCEELTFGWRPTLPGDGSRLYFFRGPVGSVEVWVREVTSGEERLIRAVGPFSDPDTHFHVTPRHELVWAPIDEGRQELWLAELR